MLWLSLGTVVGLSVLVLAFVGALVLTSQVRLWWRRRQLRKSVAP